MVAMSNTNGGNIIIGVGDNGETIGLSLDEANNLNQTISNIATNNVQPNISPTTRILLLKEKRVLVISIPKGIDKPYCDKDGIYWVKVGAYKRKAVREEIQRMFQEIGKLHADEQTFPFTSIDDIDIDNFKAYLERYDQIQLDTLNIGVGEILTYKKLMYKGEATLSGLLLFGKNQLQTTPRPYFETKCVSFFGTDVTGREFRDNEDFKGTLKEMYSGTINFLHRNLRKIQVEKSFNSPGQIEISMEALEEAVANAFVHRDYFIMSSIKIFIFDDRIEIHSPGVLPNSLDIENIKFGTSVPRNPIIQTFASKILPFKGLGTGIRRIVQLESETTFINDKKCNRFVVTFPRKSL